MQTAYVPTSKCQARFSERQGQLLRVQAYGLIQLRGFYYALACISLVSEAVFFVGSSESVLSGPAVLPQPNRVPFFLSALGYS